MCVMRSVQFFVMFGVGTGTSTTAGNTFATVPVHVNLVLWYSPPQHASQEKHSEKMPRPPQLHLPFLLQAAAQPSTAQQAVPGCMQSANTGSAISARQQARV